MTNKDTRFQKGVSGNRKGRPLGSRNQSSLAAEMLLENQATAITQKCIDMAMQGDTTAIKLCLSRLIPIRRERSITIGLPPLESSQDTLRAIETVLEAVGSGAITPSEGQILASLLEAYRRIFEVEELEHRIETLEAQQCAAR
jgi:hypothetical protein